MSNISDFKLRSGLVVSSTATVQSTLNSTSTTTGALTVSGGVGIRKDLNVGGEVRAGYMYSNGAEVLTTASVLNEKDTLATVTAEGNVTTSSIYAADMYSNSQWVLTTSSVQTQLGIAKAVSTVTNQITLALIPGSQGLTVDFGSVTDPTGPIIYDFGVL